MPTNEQRRQTAKRKLERQLESRAARARKRKQLTIAGTAVGAVLVVGIVALLYVVNKGDDESAAASATSTTEAPPTGSPLPPGRVAPLPASVDCTYTPGEAAAKPNTPPQATGVSAEGTQAVTMTTSAGPIGLTLDRALAPCTVNSFVSLTGQGYFNDTTCHRLSTTGLYVLQCGDPTGTGKGGPGYGFDNEFPTDQFAPEDPALQAASVYPRGTVAMANTGQPGSNGSQFFLVYDDSPLPPNYTVFGTIDDAGLATLATIAAAGDDGSISAGGGKPNLPVNIATITVS